MNPSIPQLATEAGAAEGAFQARISWLKERLSDRTRAPVRMVFDGGSRKAWVMRCVGSHH